MAEEAFLARWSRRKADARVRGPDPAPRMDAGAAPPDERMPAAQATPADGPPDAVLPSMEDALRADPHGDFAPFVARGVDAGVRRAALRVLFADPHFSVMDGLDVYIGDYTQAAPMPPAMLAALAHAQSILANPDQSRQNADADTPDEQ